MNLSVDLASLPPVIGDGIDPRLTALLHRVPSSVRVVFAGPDALFLDALRRIYAMPLPCPDVLVYTKADAIVVVSSPASKNTDGLVLAIEHDGTAWHVQPALVCLEPRAAEARNRMRDIDADAVDETMAALDSLVFRRIVPAERVS